MKFNFWKKKIKLNNSEENQLVKITSFLESIDHKMVDDIKKILNGEYGLNKKNSNTTIEYFDFELKEDGFGIDFYPMDKDNTQLGYKKILPEYPNGFLRDMDLDIDTDNYDFDNDSEMERMDEFYVQLQIKVIDWFNRCWIKAGGLNAKESYVIKIHDSSTMFDLKRQKWSKNNN